MQNRYKLITHFEDVEIKDVQLDKIVKIFPNLAIIHDKGESDEYDKAEEMVELLNRCC